MVCKYQFFTSFCNEVTCRYAGFCLRSNLSCALDHVNSWFLKNFVTLSHLPSSVSPTLFPDLFFSSVIPFLLAHCPYFADMPVFIKTFLSPHFPPPLHFSAPLTVMNCCLYVLISSCIFNPLPSVFQHYHSTEVIITCPPSFQIHGQFSVLCTTTYTTA